MNDERKPTEYDLVLGGNNPPPVDGLVLGGIEGIKRRLESNEIEVRIAAVRDALDYQDEGLDLVIQALDDSTEKVSRFAYEVIREKTDEKIRKAIQQYKFWDLEERLSVNEYPRYATIFANRTVEIFDPKKGIRNPLNIAYILESYEYEENFDFRDKINFFLQDSKIAELKALIKGGWRGGHFISWLVDAKEKLSSLEAFYLASHSDYQISWIYHDDLSPILQTYPNLKIFQVRGSPQFSPLKHLKLEALIIEAGALNSNKVKQICELELPVLEHLELWLGSQEYGGNSCIDDLQPILFGTAYPNLVYLGLRNSEYSDDIAVALVNAPVMKIIKVLDLSMSTLTDRGVDALLKCPEIKQLDLLKVSHNYLSNNAVNKLKKLNIRVIADRQRNSNSQYRYCSVSE